MVAFGGMPPLDRPTAESILSPILSKIQRCIEDAWKTWNAFYAPQHHILDARARASIVYCHIVANAAAVFQGVPDVTVGRKRGIFRLFIGSDIALRFKKARKNGTTSNISTHQQKLIDLQLSIPEILPGTMLNGVYVLDELQREIKKIMVTHQMDGSVQWSLLITGDPQTPVPMPIPSGGPSPKSRRPSLKDAKDRKRKDGSGSAS